MRTTSLFLLAVLTASSAKMMNYYYQKTDGTIVRPIRKNDGSVHPWTEVGGVWHNLSNDHDLYPGVQLCEQFDEHAVDISDADLPYADLSNARPEVLQFF